MSWTKKITLLYIGAFALLLPFSFTAVADQANSVSVSLKHGSHKKDNPAIRSAIQCLEKAKTELQAASHDFGGHRADAVAECDKAIQQLTLALQHAKIK